MEAAEAWTAAVEKHSAAWKNYEKSRNRTYPVEKAIQPWKRVKHGGNGWLVRGKTIEASGN
ncbi:hypothetical protein [Alteribacillus sp. HJP-4]|uniref:hypothetical protein n=1 Tax=Alteribacillus sp. HJP-4 TaxID=2775394 RepID=UPI0035CD29C1